jgi:hypothetical protein
MLLPASELGWPTDPSPLSADSSGCLASASAFVSAFLVLPASFSFEGLLLRPASCLLGLTLRTELLPALRPLKGLSTVLDPSVVTSLAST